VIFDAFVHESEDVVAIKDDGHIRRTNVSMDDLIGFSSGGCHTGNIRSPDKSLGGDVEKNGLAP
jgi:hypothetical protein